MTSSTVRRTPSHCLLIALAALTAVACSDTTSSTAGRSASTAGPTDEEVSDTTMPQPGDTSLPADGQPGSTSATTVRTTVRSTTTVTAAAPAAPAAPSSFRATAVGGTSAQLLWNPSPTPGVTYLLSGKGGRTVLTLFGPFDTSDTGYPLTGLELDASYKMALVAVDAGGRTSPSVEVSFDTTKGAPPTGHSTVSTVCAGQLVKASVALHSTDPDGDIVKYSLTQDVGFGSTFKDTTGAISFTVPATMKKGQSFSFKWTVTDSMTQISTPATWIFNVGTLLGLTCI